MAYNFEKDGRDLASSNKPIPWRITEDGALLLGERGEMVVLDSNERLDADRTGKPPYLKNAAPPWKEFESFIKRVDCVGDIKCEGPNFYSFFSGLSEVEDIDISKMDMSAVANMNSMFYECPKLKHVSLPTELRGEPKYCSSLFENCTSLETVDNLDELCKTKAKDIAHLFSYCENLKRVDLSHWDVRDVDNMTGMFAGCYSLEDVKLSGWDTSNVEDMTGMFAQCHSLGSLDISHFKTDNLNRTVAMFDECSNLEIVYLPAGKNPKLVNVDEMFAGCESLSSNISYFDVSNAVLMTGILDNCNPQFIKDNMPALKASYDSGRVINVDGLAPGAFKKCLNPMAMVLDVNDFTVAIPKIAIKDQPDGTKSVSFIKDKFYPGRDSDGEKEHYSGRDIKDTIDYYREASNSAGASFDFQTQKISMETAADGPEL